MPVVPLADCSPHDGAKKYAYPPCSLPCWSMLHPAPGTGTYGTRDIRLCSTCETRHRPMLHSSIRMGHVALRGNMVSDTACAQGQHRARRSKRMFAALALVAWHCCEHALPTIVIVDHTACTMWCRLQACGVLCGPSPRGRRLALKLARLTLERVNDIVVLSGVLSPYSRGRDV